MKLPETLPAFDRLVMDSSGNLWIRQRVDGAGNTTWMVFDDEYAFLGEVKGLASRLEVTEIGADYVLGFLSGEVSGGADRVLLYDLHRGS